VDVAIGGFCGSRRTYSSVLPADYLQVLVGSQVTSILHYTYLLVGSRFPSHPFTVLTHALLHTPSGFCLYITAYPTVAVTPRIPHAAHHTVRGWFRLVTFWVAGTHPHYCRSRTLLPAYTHRHHGSQLHLHADDVALRGLFCRQFLVTHTGCYRITLVGWFTLLRATRTVTQLRLPRLHALACLPFRLLPAPFTRYTRYPPAAALPATYLHHYLCSLPYLLPLVLPVWVTPTVAVTFAALPHTHARLVTLTHLDSFFSPHADRLRFAVLRLRRSVPLTFAAICLLVCTLTPAAVLAAGSHLLHIPTYATGSQFCG